MIVHADALQDSADVVDVVRDRELAVFVRHPAGDDALLPRVERMQGLRGDDQPPVRSRNRLERLHVIAGCIRVAVEADE